MVSPVPPGGDQNGGSIDISVNITANQNLIQRAKALLTDFKKHLTGAVEPDKPRIEQAFRHYTEQARKAFQETQKNATVTERWVEQVSRLRRQASLDELSKALARATNDGEKFEKTLKRVNDELRAIGASDDEIDSVLASAGNRAVVGGKRGAALQAFGREARLSVPAFNIPGSPVGTEFLFRVAEVAGRLNLSFKDLAISGGAASLAIIGISLAIQNFQKVIEPAQKQLEGIIAARQELAGILAQGDPQQVVNRRDQAQKELLRLEGERNQALEDQARLATELLGKNQAPDILRTLFGAPVEATFDLLASGPLTKVQGDVTRLNAEYSAQQVLVAELTKEYERAQVQQKIIDLQKEYTAQLERSGPVFEQLRQQYDDTIAAFELANAQRDEDRRLADQFEAEDEALQDEARADAHQDALAAIEEAGNDRIEKLREGLIDRTAELESKRDEKLADIAKNRDEAIAKIHEDAREDEEKAEEDYQKERIRRLEDQAQDLFDAEISNDVSAFIKAQQRAKQENERAEEDHEDEQARRSAASEDRIAEIQAEADERTRIALDQFNKEKSALETKTQEAIVTELAAIDERTAKAIEAYDKETTKLIEARERADARQAILEGVQDQRRYAAHLTALAQIEQRRLAENLLFTDILVALNKARNQLAAINGITYTPLAGPAPVNPSGPSPTAFANGGLITKPTFALMGERPGYGDALIPFRKSEGIEAALAKLGARTGGTVFNISLSNVNLGAVTETTLRRELTHVVGEMAQGLGMARGAA